MHPFLLIMHMHMQALDFSSNFITGPLASGTSALVALRYLALDANQVRGTLPGDLSVMQLRHLSLSGNALSGPIPPGFSNLTALKLLDLGSNQLTGSLPMSLFRLPQMMTLVSRSSLLTPWLPPPG